MTTSTSGYCWKGAILQDQVATAEKAKDNAKVVNALRLLRDHVKHCPECQEREASNDRQ